MNGRKLLSLLLAVLISLPVTAYAQGNDKSRQNSGKGKEQQTVQTSKVQGQPADKDKAGNAKTEQDKVKDNEHKQDAMQNKDEKKQQIEAFKTQMRDKHDQMKDLREQTIALKQQIAQKRAQLAVIVADIQAGNKTLTEDMLNQLLAAAQNLKIDADQVQTTAEITGEVSDTQDKVNSGDFNNALTSMGGVIVKLQARLEALKQLNEDLDKALEIANKATTPVPTTGTGDTTTTTPTTGTGGTTTTTPTTGTGDTTTTTPTTGTGDTTTTQPTTGTGTGTSSQTETTTGTQQPVPTTGN